ncbi:MAG: hypothetical protein OXE73_00580 [Gammaproteobacteria bacterium]|nr:hypothetical protein [Gammaproteobacteria bacterium]
MRRPRIGGIRTYGLLSAFALAAVGACDSLTGPSFPEVAGTYTGPLTVEVAVVSQGVPNTITANGTMRVVVEQDTDQVTLSASMTILGDTETLDTLTGTIDEGGVWTETGANAGAFVLGDDECGYTANAAVRFSGGSLTIEATSTVSQPTIDCPNVTWSAELART